MTIYALSTGPGISGIAVIRISGEETSRAIEFINSKLKDTKSNAEFFNSMNKPA